VLGIEFDKMVIVGVRERLTNWLLRAWGVVDKLVIVGIGDSLTN
jgi:hypothetical protein